MRKTPIQIEPERHLPVAVPPDACLASTIRPPLGLQPEQSGHLRPVGSGAVLVVGEPSHALVVCGYRVMVVRLDKHEVIDIRRHLLGRKCAVFGKEARKGAGPTAKAAWARILPEDDAHRVLGALTFDPQSLDSEPAAVSGRRLVDELAEGRDQPFGFPPLHRCILACGNGPGERLVRGLPD